MKKRIISMLLIGAMAISLCACGDSNTSSSTAESGNTSSENVSQVQANPSSQYDDGLPKGDKDLIASWGYLYNPRTEDANYFINVPAGSRTDTRDCGIKSNILYKMPDSGYNYVMDQRDPYGNIAKDAAKTVEEIRPTYEEWILYELKEAEEYAHKVENQKMTVDSTENIKVNEYEICVTKGIYSCDINESSGNISKEYPYICYATFLTTGTPVYWVLIDRTDDKSKDAEMEEVAMNMAKTLREYDPDDEMSKKEAYGDADDGMSKD